MPATIRRGSRCGVCYWGLYDGDWCQNAACAMHGKSVGDNRIHLTNEEAAILLAHSHRLVHSPPRDSQTIQREGRKSRDR